MWKPSDSRNRGIITTTITTTQEAGGEASTGGGPGTQEEVGVGEVGAVGDPTATGQMMGSLIVMKEQWEEELKEIMKKQEIERKRRQRRNKKIKMVNPRKTVSVCLEPCDWWTFKNNGI